MRRRAQEEPAWSDLNEAACLEAAIGAALDFQLAGLRHTRNWHYDGPVLMLRSQISLKQEGPSTAHGTFARHLTGDVQWFEAGSTHIDVIRGQSELAARQIRQCLDIAREALGRLAHVPTSSTRAERSACEPR